MPFILASLLMLGSFCGELCTVNAQLPTDDSANACSKRQAVDKRKSPNSEGISVT